MKKLNTRSPWQAFMDLLIFPPVSFETHGNLSGETATPGYPKQIGRLPEQYHDDISRAAYLVYSYGTPIAWMYADGEWTMPGEKYSQTTSQHQSKIRTALVEGGQFG